MIAIHTRRRLFLLSMLATTLGVIVLTGWLLWRGQPRSVVAILKYGGFVRYGDEFELNERGSVGEPRGEAKGPNWLRHMGRSSFTDVVQVSLVYAETEAGNRLEPLTKLRYLHLSGSQITSAGFRHLKSLTRLEGLSLQENYLSDDGLEYLQGLTNLRSLHIGMSKGQITDEGLKKLSALTNLEVLDIQSSKVTDQGLGQLKDLPRLREIWFGGSQITVSGLPGLGYTDSGHGGIAKKEPEAILDQEMNSP